MEIFTILKDWWVSSSAAFSSIVDLFSKSLNELIIIDIPIVSHVANLLFSIVVGGTAESPITLGQVSLFSFLLGSMISLFVTITIVKWFIGIIT